MKQIRINTFETNSSSTHSLVISTENEFKLVTKGKLYICDNIEVISLDAARKKLASWDIYADDLKDFDDYVHKKDYASLDALLKDHGIYKYDDWCDMQYDNGLETFTKTFESPSGDKMIAWGRYGYNG